MAEPKAMVLELLAPIAKGARQLSDLKKEIAFTGRDPPSLEHLIHDLEETERQLSTLAGFISRSELSDSHQRNCELSVRNLQVEVNLLGNQIGALVMKSTQKNVFLRAKTRVLIAGGELNKVREQISRVDAKIGIIRGEIQLDIALKVRDDARSETKAVKEQLQVIERNTNGTEAGRIRKQYKQFAQKVITEEHMMIYAHPSPAPRETECPGTDTGAPSENETRLPHIATVNIKEIKFTDVEPGPRKKDILDIEMAFSETPFSHLVEEAFKSRSIIGSFKSRRKSTRVVTAVNRVPDIV